MPTNIMPSNPSRTTRLIHAGLALTIITQLVTSQLLTPPDEVKGDFFFLIHQYSGLAALVFAFGFWLTIMRHKNGTSLGALVPWFSGARIRAVIADLNVHFTAAKSLRLPGYDEHSPLASAVHGLGLLLMTVMAVTGGLFYLASFFGAEESAAIHADLWVHMTLANLVWAYLIAHASLAALHHFMHHFSISRMWSLR